jgi:hypothetical protein
MRSIETYSRHCATCNTETQHVAVLSRGKRRAMHVGKLIAFFLSFATAYPHILSSSGGDAFAVSCTKCNSRGTISYQ